MNFWGFILINKNIWKICFFDLAKASVYVVIVLAIFQSFQSVHAAYVGNPSNPAILEEGVWISDLCWSNARVGVSGDYLIQKRLRACHASHLRHSQPEMQWVLAVGDIDWNVRERFDAKILFGAITNFELKWLQDKKKLKGNSHQGFYWGAKSSLIVLEIQDTTLGVDVHVGGINGIRGSISNTRESFSSRFYYWQLAAGISQALRSFRPYIGGVVNHFTCIVSPKFLRKIRLHDLVKTGLYEGCSLNLGTRGLIGIEARQFFESSITFSGELRF